MLTPRGLARWARYLPDRLLHPIRRRLAQGKLQPAAASVVFVCLGNICRSPYAAALLRRLAPLPDLRVSSAGFIGPGRPAAPDAVETAGARGIDLTAHSSRLLTADMVATAGLVVVMDARQARAVRRLGAAASRVLVLGDLDPQPIGRRAIPDPFQQPAEVFSATYDRIDRCLTVLAGELKTAPE